MKCPHCQESLVMSERQGIEIDYCPACRGIWLDRGELDKLIERSTALTGSSHGGPSQGGPSPVRKDYYDHSHGTKHKGKHKRESFWGELFDFD